LIEVCKIEEIRRRKGLMGIDGMEHMEIDIIKHMEKEGWQLEERYCSPSKDEYSEIVEFPLNNYSFSKDEIVDVRLEIDYS
jgi:hypothetical protein